MTKTMRLMALGLSVVVFTGCSAVEDLVNEYADDQEEEYQGYQDDGNTNSGGNNYPETVTGVFQDANVAGLNYACSSGKTDLTTGEGEYTCNVGDTVEFSLGGYVLGSVTATSGIVTPMSLYPYDLVAATNVLQLLQTLDSGEDGTITIPENFSELDDVTTGPTDSAFDDVMEAELDKPLVSEDDAQAHMLKTLLAGKTLYTGVWGEMATFESMSFASDLTSSSWQEIVDVDDRLDYGNGTLTIDGMIITYTCTYDSGYDNPSECSNEEPYIMTVTEIREDYMLVLSKDEEGEENVNMVYYDEAKARAYFLSGGESTTSTPTADLAALLAGNTLYITIYDEMNTLESWTFNADLTSATWRELVGGSDAETGTLIVDGMTMVFSDSDGTSIIEVTEILEDYMFVSMNGGDAQRLYYDETKAREYFLSAGVSLSSIAITETMLSGKTFYDTYTDYNDDMCYANMTISATSGTRHEVCYTPDGSEKGNDTFTFSIELIEGKIKIDAGDQYKWFALTAQDDTAWHMLNDDDDGKDGTLDSIGEQNTWYLSKPAGFPESL